MHGALQGEIDERGRGRGLGGFFGGGQFRREIVEGLVGGPGQGGGVGEAAVVLGEAGFVVAHFVRRVDDEGSDRGAGGERVVGAAFLGGGEFEREIGFQGGGGGADDDQPGGGKPG